MNNRITRKG